MPYNALAHDELKRRGFSLDAGQFTAPGWVRDENGALKRETKPRMNRRLPGFDYSQRMIYEITIAWRELAQDRGVSAAGQDGVECPVPAA